MQNELETIPKKHINTIVRKQRLSIMQLKRIKKQLVRESTLVKKQLDEEKKTKIELSTELERMEEKLKINQQGFWNFFKKFLRKLQIFRDELLIFVLAFLLLFTCTTFTKEATLCFILLENIILGTCYFIFGLSNWKNDYSHKVFYQNQIESIHKKMEKSKQYQCELEKTLEKQLQSLTQY